MNDAIYTVTKMSSVTPKELTWLWPGRIPKGKITVFAGAPGVGKGLATCSLVAIATTGSEYPDEGIGEHEPCDVIMLSCEDDLEDTVVPRLMAAGADLEKVVTIKAKVKGNDKKKIRDLSFDTDLEILKTCLNDNPKVKLVIIDPITSYLGKANSNDEQEVRRVLVPLADLASETGVTVVLVAHFNKRSDVSALNKIMGAVALPGVSRSAWMFAEVSSDEDGEPSDRYHMLQGKLNVSKKKKGLEYTIGSKQILPKPAEEIGFIVWGSETNVTADKAFNSNTFGPSPDKREKAKNLILKMLEKGEVKATSIFNAADSEGISAITVKRAKSNLEIETRRHDNASYWRLPMKTESSNDDFQQDQAAY